MDFLKKILILNHYPIKVNEEESPKKNKNENKLSSK